VLIVNFVNIKNLVCSYGIRSISRTFAKWDRKSRDIPQVKQIFQVLSVSPNQWENTVFVLYLFS